MTTESSTDILEVTANSVTTEAEAKEEAKPKARTPRSLIFLVDVANNSVRAYRSAAMAGGAQAEDIKNQIMIGRIEDMDKLSTATLVALHNIIRPEKPIKKFADRATANKRMFPALEVLAGKPIEGGTSTVAPKAKKTAARKTTGEKTEKSTNGGAGRASVYTGKVITKLVDENPRREGTAGHTSFGVIKNGMTYEQYIAKGGRRKDLAWDEAHKYVKVSKA